ncbi:YfiR family protein [Desulfopila sp. IMCC35008]|uniref:YfiR family protein n=1 Tax=Desulfopila sp. IMCC35008 TaxID=2653858 RepID=UPI0013CFE4B0|nr:YfiR family protein [Desulfopila sp. IMCC35008]
MVSRQTIQLLGASLLAAMLCLQPVRAGTVVEEDLKAAFVYRFTQYTKWPISPEKEFRLCLYGSTEVTKAIEQLSGRLIQGSPLSITRPSSGNIPEGKCHAAFLGVEDRNQLRSLVQSRADQPILLISDMPGAFDERIDIALFTEPNRVSFSINRTQAHDRMLTFSSQMLKLANKIR